MVLEQSGLRTEEIEGVLQGNWQADPVLARLAAGPRAPASAREDPRHDHR